MGLEGWPASPLSRLGLGSAFMDAYVVGLSVRLAVTLCQPMSACVSPEDDAVDNVYFWCSVVLRSLARVPSEVGLVRW